MQTKLGEEIIEEILRTEKVKLGDLINYKQFLDLYKPYFKRITERLFAKFLGITSGSYSSTKDRGTRAKVQDYKYKEKLDRIKKKVCKESRYFSKEELEELSRGTWN